MNGQLLVSGLTQLSTWIKQLRTADDATRARWRGAINALQTAVLETKAYVAQHQRDAGRDRQAEQKLFRLWAEASNSFYELDGQLASRLQLKAEDRTDPAAWTSQEVLAAGISLDDVAQYTRQLLHER